MMPQGIDFSNVPVTYRNGHTALQDATFSVPAGSDAALVGEMVPVNRHCLKQ